ncbi:MAG TPA: glycosyltransferase, partial [Patescibacteria group bacterium]|nr:glycosyltransferase [Patescibacteria group bacterium]
MKKYMKLSIVIVEYKSGKHLEKLVSAIPKKEDWEVIVVDNTKNNIGFGAGCNKGALRASGEYLLFLNPDVLPHNQAIERMIMYLEKHPKVAAVGPKFINATGQTEQTSTMFPTKKSVFVALSFLNTLYPNNPISRAYWMNEWNRESTKEVEVLSGAALMVRSQTFREVGGFDEQFFLYWEEFDLCKRMSGQGKSLIYLANAVFDHAKGVSVSASDENTSDHFAQSRMLFLEKHFGFFFTFLPQTWFLITEQWRALAVFISAFFLRSWNLRYITMIGDLGRDYLQALDLIQTKNLPLLGIPSSIPRLLQGPFNIWFDAGSFLLGGVSPYSPVLFAALITSIGVTLLYLSLQKEFGKYIALPLALLVATSPTAVVQSRMPFYLFAIPVFFVIFLKKLQLLNPKKSITVFWFVLSGWLIFQWEMATIPLLILIPIALWRIRPRLRHILAAVAATVVGLLPQIVYDMTHACAQLCGVVAWSGYRLVAWTGFDGRHIWSMDKLVKVFSLGTDQLGSTVGGK